MREIEIGDQAMDALRFFQWVQIFTLDIFNQRHRRRSFVVDFLDQHRYFRQARQLGGTETAFAGNDFIALTTVTRCNRAHQDRLQQTLCLD
ncbi:hypothetical protein D3C81_1458780 [compost metagenome]